MQLSPNFARAEFEIDGSPMPDDCVPIFTTLCETLLEPIREQFNLPIIITSGYRTGGENAQDGGVSSSQHIAQAGFCAADFKLPNTLDMESVFNWVRGQSDLIWDQLILEHGTLGQSDIIHLSVTSSTNRRMALEGDTANRSVYTPFPVVAVQA